MEIQILFVTLEEIAGFLCIKALQRIEKFWGYDLETVLNSMFCYKLLKEHPTQSDRLFRDSSSIAKVLLYYEITKCYSQIPTICFAIVFTSFIAIFQYFREQHHEF